MKKTTTRLFALLLCLCMVMGMATTAMAADAANATIDHSAEGSLTIYKYDQTKAAADGVWDGSYVSTGVKDQTGVNDVLNPTPAEENDLGNGEVSNGYAIKGVEFSYLKVADIVQYSVPNASGAAEVVVLYGMNKIASADLLAAIGLEAADAYDVSGADASVFSADNYYFTSQVLTDALAAALEADPTTVKNELEIYIAANGGTAMELTDENGMTVAEELPIGLYLVVETKVPEMVTITTNPFFVSVPMTSVNGDNATDGGTRWIYDITVYPKNETGLPSLEKTVRESSEDTGINNGSDAIDDGYAHTGSASAGDVVEYQILSNLPGITSGATYLSQYGFVDTLSAGLSYNKSDVVIEFFSDTACTNKIATWSEADETAKFTVGYTTNDDGSTTMSIAMTDAGLAEINAASTVYTAENAVESGYSDCMVRVTYAATVDSNDELVLGDDGNANSVVLTWSRTSEDYFDTLVDDTHIYSYGIDLTKLFSNNNGDLSKVNFVVKNSTDNYWVKAEFNAEEGVYYVIDHVAAEADATLFVPHTDGKIVIKGLENDTYVLTETQTDDGFSLLDSDITIVISNTESTTECDIYASDVLGLLQNDPRYANLTADDLANIPQQALQHYLLTASATIDGNDVTMLADGDSVNGYAPLSVTNTPGFDLPQTGEIGAIVIPMLGITLIVCAVLFLVANKRRKNA